MDAKLLGVRLRHATTKRASVHQNSRRALCKALATCAAPVCHTVCQNILRHCRFAALNSSPFNAPIWCRRAKRSRSSIAQDLRLPGKMGEGCTSSTTSANIFQGKRRLSMHSSMHALPEVVKCMKTIGFLGRRWQTFWKMCTPPTHFLGRRRSFFRKLKVSHSLKQIHVFQGNAWEGCKSSTTSANVCQENLWFSYISKEMWGRGARLRQCLPTSSKDNVHFHSFQDAHTCIWR